MMHAVSAGLLIRVPDDKWRPGPSDRDVPAAMQLAAEIEFEQRRCEIVAQARVGQRGAEASLGPAAA